MKKLKLIYIFSLSISFLLMAGESLAQQVPVYSQYMFNKFILNPAIAGSEGYTAYNITSRVQWMGFKDAPITNSISAQTRLLKSKLLIRFNKKRIKYLAPEHGTVGLGFHLYNDLRGVLNQTSMQFTYAYHEKTDLKSQLSFGLTMSLTQFKVNSDRLVPYQPDNYLNSTKLAVLIPDFNLGMYYTTQYGYLGIAIAHLLQSASYLGGYDENKFKLERNYNIMGGYRIPFNPKLAMEPSFQYKTTEQFFYQLDMGCRLYYLKDLWGGMFYRTGSSMVITFGARYKNLYFGYAYDYSFNSLQTYSFGTNELTMSLKFAQYERKYKWIERF